MSADFRPQLPETDPEWARRLFISAHEYGFTRRASYIAWLQLTLARPQYHRTTW